MKKQAKPLDNFNGVKIGDRLLSLTTRAARLKGEIVIVVRVESEVAIRYRGSKQEGYSVKPWEFAFAANELWNVM